MAHPNSQGEYVQISLRLPAALRDDLAAAAASELRSVNTMVVLWLADCVALAKRKRKRKTLENYIGT